MLGICDDCLHAATRDRDVFFYVSTSTGVTITPRTGSITITSSGPMLSTGDDFGCGSYRLVST